MRVGVEDNDVLTLPTSELAPGSWLSHTFITGLMMALSQSSELAFVGAVTAQIFVDNGCEN